VTVPKTHAALITEDEARGILAARRQARGSCTISTNRGRSLTSDYLLSGGLFQCGRCKANMIGLRKSNGEYYVCGSEPYRLPETMVKGVVAGARVEWSPNQRCVRRLSRWRLLKAGA